MKLIEVITIIVVMAIMLAVVLPLYIRENRKARRTHRISNVKQIGLAYQVWSSDHRTHYPMALAETNGGSMEFVTGANAFRHFQLISNELSTHYILVSPSEAFDLRSRATNVTYFRLSNGYFVGVDANEPNYQMILSGDRTSRTAHQ